ncbi:MAG TPA: hypothetical protein VM143_09990 [Acidimicrobiales bacterium]|nr:hypothetical protein [Acidimicrobiales bacterium]
MTHRAPMRVVALLAASLLVAACGPSRPDRLEFGVQRIALGIAFVDEDAAPPPEPEVIVRLIPAPPEVYQPGFDFESVRVRDDDEAEDEGDDDIIIPPLPPRCPAASPEATIDLPVSPSVLDPPAPGRYPRANAGSIELVTAGPALKFPYPFESSWLVSPERKAAGKTGTVALPSNAPTGRQWTVTKQLGGFQTIELMELASNGVLLVERRIVNAGVETVLRPDPPVTFFQFGAEGDSWNSAGADVAHDLAIVIQGSIKDRAVIDVCGVLAEAFVIGYTEQVVNLATGETSGTDSAEPSTVFYAPQYGGLVVKEQMHTTQRVTAADGSPVVINLDYVSTLTSIDPT